jgi:AmpE protein
VFTAQPGEVAEIQPEATIERSIFLAVHERLFAVLFWFCLLGPMGAVLYRMTALSAENDAPFTLPALTARRWLDWLPIRLFALLCALAGHFTAVFAIFKKHALDGIAANDTLLMECSAAALSATADPTEIPHEPRQAQALLDRVFIIGLVLLALIVLIV